MTEVRNYTIDEFKDFVSSRLAPLTDTELLILQGNVILEYTINCYLESLSTKYDAAFFAHGFSFLDKINLIENFTDIKIPGSFSILEELRLLNELRNDIAYDLSFKAENVHSFVLTLREKNVLKSQGDDHDSLRESVGILAAVVFAAFKANSRGKQPFN